MTVTVNSFLEAIRLETPGLPSPKTDSFLEACLAEEYTLRGFFASDPENLIIRNPYVGLFDIFDLESQARLSRPRREDPDSDIVWRNHRLPAKYILPVKPYLRRAPGTPCIVEDLTAFRRAWDIFTGGALSAIKNWDNIIVAGGSVLTCLSHSSDDSPKNLYKIYQSRSYKHSDIDLFLWGMTEDEVFLLFFC